MKSALTAFFDEYARREWAPGTVDCCLMLADWAVWQRFPDPAAHLRGTYHSDDGFWKIIDAAGGLPMVVGVCAGSIGAAPAGEPVIGAIGVIGSRTNLRKQFGAIFDGEGWNIRFVNGVARMHARQLAAWNLTF